MKNTLQFFWGATFILMIMGACSDNQEKVDENFISQNDIATLINHYNENLKTQFGKHAPESKLGFVKDGFIEINTVVEDNHRIYSLATQNNSKEYFRYSFTTSNESDIISSLNNGQFIFLGDQIIIQDLAQMKVYNYVISGRNGHLTDKFPTIALDYIKGETASDLKSFSGCTCACQRCYGSFCTTTSCGCDSACGGGCWVTCNSSSNAICSDDCGEQ